MSITLALLLAACGSSPTALPTLASTIGPIPTRTAFPTVTPIESRLPITGVDALPTLLPTRERYDPLSPTQTARAAEPTRPMPTFEPSPTPEPVPTGQLSNWILGLIPSSQGLWAMQPDGTQLTLLTEDPIDHMTASPGGTWGAYVTHVGTGALYEQPYGYLLKLITFRDSRTYHITTLDPPGLNAESAPATLDAAVQALSAYQRGAMQWSPNGSTLAFTSSHEAEPGLPASADIYLYNPSAGTLRRLTQLNLPEGPVYAHNLNWSPDGRRIFFNVAHSFGASAASADTWLAGSYTVDMAGQLVPIEGGANSSGERLLAWMPGPSMLLTSRSLLCGDSNLRTFNLRDNSVTSLWPGCYSDLIYNRSHYEVLISVSEEVAMMQENTQPGLYLARTYQPGLTQLSTTGFERIYTGDSRASWYGYNTGQGMFAILRSGETYGVFVGPPFDSSEGVLYRPVNRLAGSEDWLWTNVKTGEVFVAQRGGGTQLLARPPFDLTSSPWYTGLYFFFSPSETGAELYGVRARDWEPFLIDNRIREPDGILWIP